jgi:hypothetical protein
VFNIFVPNSKIIRLYIATPIIADAIITTQTEYYRRDFGNFLLFYADTSS